MRPSYELMCKGYYPVRFYKVKNKFCKAEKCVCTKYKYSVTNKVK